MYKMEQISGDDCFLVLDNEEYILFYFTATWCGPCQRIYPEILQFIKELKTDKIRFYKIDISDDDNNEIVEKCNVNSVPTFILLRNRTYIDEVNGADISAFNNLILNNCKLK